MPASRSAQHLDQSTMSATVGTVDMDVRSGLKLLSLDAGGAQAISQLRILDHVMDKISRGAVKRPCDIFDIIGGVGTGGLIAIFLVVLKMTAKEALEEFTKFAVEVYKDVDQDPKKQTEKLKRVLHGIIEKHGINKDMEIMTENEPTPTCRLIIPISYKNNVNVTCVLRNYTIRQEPPTNLTIAEAMLATSATTPMFTPVSIEKEFSSFEYISGDLGLSNPVREVIAEGHHAFGDEATIACLLSIGSGHPGVNSVPRNSDAVSRADFFERVAINGEKMAQEIATQTSQLTIYHRLSVNMGLETLQSRAWREPEDTAAHTTVYLSDLEVTKLVDRCVDTIRTGYGSATLEQLRHSGGANILPAPLPPLTTNYVERKAPMDFIIKALFDQNGRVKSGSKRIVVTGIGGCGKTQLVRKFVENNRDHFISTFIVDGSSREALRRNLVRHVRSLNAAHSQDSFEDSMAFLSQSIPKGQRLLIIDNVDDPTLDLTPFFPRWENGAVIVTSRNASRRQLNPNAHLQLDVMSLDEAVELLVRGSGREWPASGPDKDTAIAVAEELGCHPIALVQAISYMASTGYSAEAYITRLRGYRELLLKDPATNQLDMRYMTAFAAFDASYHILPSNAQSTLHLLSFFHPKRFPLGLVTRAAEDDFSTDNYNFVPHGEDFKYGKGYLSEIFCSSGNWDLRKLDSAVMSLRNQSLIALEPAQDVMLLGMHSLVHEWSRLRVPRGMFGRVKAAAIRLLCCGARLDNYRMMQYLVNHIQAFSFAWGDLNPNDAASFGFILGESGMYVDAAKLDERAYSTVKIQLGADHPHAILASGNLAVAYDRLGRYADAELLKVEGLRRRKQLLGTDHPDTIWTSASLATTYRHLGRYAEAEVLELEVLRQRKQSLGDDHPMTIDAASNLANTYGQLGRYADAELLEVEALRQLKRLLGTEHPHTILASGNLAITYDRLGRYADAELLKVEVLGLRKRLLGIEHPDTITASASLADTYTRLGRYADAEVLGEEALRKREQLLGVDHLETIKARECLAVTYIESGKHREAVALLLDVLKQRKQLQGEQHPETIMASGNLAVAYVRLRRYADAEVLEVEVLKRRKQLLGMDHPHTLAASANLAMTYGRLGRYAEAEALKVEVLGQQKRALGMEHPHTIQTSASLAITYSQLGRYAEAEMLELEVLRLRKRLLGVEHPHTIDASENLAITYYDLERYAASKVLQTEVVSLRKAVLGLQHPDTLSAGEFLTRIEGRCKPLSDRIFAHLERLFS